MPQEPCGTSSTAWCSKDTEESKAGGRQAFFGDPLPRAQNRLCRGRGVLGKRCSRYPQRGTRPATAAADGSSRARRPRPRRGTRRRPAAPRSSAAEGAGEGGGWSRGEDEALRGTRGTPPAPQHPAAPGSRCWKPADGRRRQRPRSPLRGKKRRGIRPSVPAAGGPAAAFTHGVQRSLYSLAMVSMPPLRATPM